MDSVFLRGVTLSGLLHAGAIIFAVMVLPDRLATLPPGTDPIAVEIVNPRDVARLPAAEASRDEIPQIAQADTSVPEAPDTPPSDDGDSPRVAALPAPARTEPAAREKPRSDDAESGPEPAAKPALATPDEASGDAVADDAAGGSTVAEAAPESIASAPRPEGRDESVAGRPNNPTRAIDRAVSSETLDKPSVAAPDQASGDAVADETAGRTAATDAAPEQVAPPERPRQPDQAIARRRSTAEPAGDQPSDEQTLPKPILIRTDSAPPAAAVADTGRTSAARSEAPTETAVAARQSSDTAEAPRTRDRQASAHPRDSDAAPAPLPPPPKKKQPAKKPTAPKKPPVQQARRVEPPKQKHKPPPDAGFPLCGSLLPKLETRLRPRDCASVRNMLNHTLETSRSGQMSIWRSGDRSYLGKVLPMEGFTRPDGTPCREFIQTMKVRGEERVASGTACRDRGRPVWRIVM